MVLGAQLYTVRDFTKNERELSDTLKKIYDIGYRTVQISAVGADITPETIRKTCDNYQLEIALTHWNVERILNETERVIDEHNIMGCNYIGIGMMPEKYRNKESIKEFIHDFRKPAEKIAKAGKMLMYHNHDLEFEKYNGKTIMEQLMEGFQIGEMGFTLDTYWVQHGGADVCEWIEKLNGRIPCVHLKDMAVINHESVMSVIMEGNINFRKVTDACAKSGCHYMLIEQDICPESQGTPFECLEKSYNNLTTLGYR